MIEQTCLLSHFPGPMRIFPRNPVCASNGSSFLHWFWASDVVTAAHKQALNSWCTLMLAADGQLPCCNEIHLALRSHYFFCSPVFYSRVIYPFLKVAPLDKIENKFTGISENCWCTLLELNWIFYELEKIYILTELTICEKVYFNISSDLYTKP